MLPLQVVFNPNSIKSMINFFTVPTKDVFIFTDGQINAIKDAVTDTFTDITTHSLIGIEYAIEEHKTLALTIDIEAPIFIFPESCLIEQCPVVLIDAGHFLVESTLANKDVLKDGKLNLNLLKDLLYDRFTINMSNVQVFTINLDSCW